jgi:signal transduction histidine kinase
MRASPAHMIKKMLQFLSSSGTDPEKSRVQQREVILCNELIILLLPVSFLAIVFGYHFGGMPSLITYTLFVALLGCAFLLNRYGYHTLSRWLLSAFPPLVLIFPFFFAAEVQSGEYHTLPYALVGFTVIPLVLFSGKSEKLALTLLLSIHFLVLTYFNLLMPYEGTHLLMHTIPHMVFWVFLVAAFQFLKRERNMVEQDLKKSNEALAKSNREYNLQKEEILTQNEYLNVKQHEIEQQATFLSRSNHELNNTKVELLKTISKLQIATDKLKEKEAEAKSILKGLDEHYLVAQYDLSGQLVTMNRKVNSLLGSLKPEHFKIVKQISGRGKAGTLKRPAIGLRRLWPSIVAGKAQTVDIEVQIEGRLRYFSTTLAPLFDRNGQPYRVLAIGQDVSELVEKNDKIDKINDELKEKISEISQQNELLKFHQGEIFHKNEVLKLQAEEIKAINESLEERVKERTQVLEEKNMQLAEYAFINSHVLRAPLSTMMGLINLISYSELSDEDQKIYQHLRETANALDSIIFKINDAIGNRAHFDRKYLEPGRKLESVDEALKNSQTTQ